MRPDPKRRTASPRARAGEALSRDGLYETDFHAWTQTQSELLRSGRLDAIDISHIAEEIESLGRSERSALESAYRLIAMHLLKIKYQPGRYSHSWYVTMMRERVNVEKILYENPGLKPMRATLFERAYVYARKDAAAETGLSRKAFPEISPFSMDQVEDDDFLPDDARIGRDK